MAVDSLSYGAPAPSSLRLNGDRNQNAFDLQERTTNCNPARDPHLSTQKTITLTDRLCVECLWGKDHTGTGGVAALTVTLLPAQWVDAVGAGNSRGAWGTWVGVGASPRASVAKGILFLYKGTARLPKVRERLPKRVHTDRTNKRLGLTWARGKTARKPN